MPAASWSYVELNRSPRRLLLNPSTVGPASERGYPRLGTHRAANGDGFCGALELHVDDLHVDAACERVESRGDRLRIGAQPTRVFHGQRRSCAKRHLTRP